MSAKRETRRVPAASPGWFARSYVTAFGVAALIGLLIGIVWIVAGLLHFHPLW